MNRPFSRTNPPPEPQRTLDLARMNQKIKNLKAKAAKPAPVVPPGVPLKPPGFYFPIISASAPAPVVFVGSVLQAQIDEKAAAEKPRKDAEDVKSQEAKRAKIYTIAKKSDRKTDKKADKDDLKEEEKKKIRPEYPMTKYEDRDDHPTYRGDSDLRCPKNIRVGMLAPGYGLHFAVQEINDDYEEPRQAPRPRPQTPPFRHLYPATSPFAGDVALPLHFSDPPSKNDVSTDVSECPWTTQSTPVGGSPTPCRIQRQVPRDPPIPSRSLVQAPRDPPTPSKSQRQQPSLRDILKAAHYHDIPADMRGDLIPPAPSSNSASSINGHDRHAKLREKLAQEKQEKVAREAERESERKARKPSEKSFDGNSVGSPLQPPIPSKRSERVWPSEADFPPPRLYQGGEIYAIKHADIPPAFPQKAPDLPAPFPFQGAGGYAGDPTWSPFPQPFTQTASERVWPSEADFLSPRAWAKPERAVSQEQSQDEIPSAVMFKDSEYTDGNSVSGSQTTKVFNVASTVDASKLNLGSDAHVRDGPSSHWAVVENSSSTSPQEPEHATTPRLPRPNMPTHARTFSRKAVYFTPDQNPRSPPTSPPDHPPPPPPKDTTGLPEIPPFLKSRSQTESPTPARYGLGRGLPPTLGAVEPLNVHKRNPSNPIPQNPHTVFDYASVTTYRERNVSNPISQNSHTVFDYASFTTSRAGRKPEGPPPVLRHRAAMSLVRRPSRLESLPINVKSNARPSMSTTKFRTDTHEGALLSGHNRSASEFGQLPIHSVVHDHEDARPVHNRSASDFTQFTIKAPLHTEAAWGSFSVSTSNYATTPPASFTMSDGHRVDLEPGHTLRASEAVHLPPHPGVYVPRHCRTVQIRRPSGV